MPNAIRNVGPSARHKAHPTVELLTYGTPAVNRPAAARPRFGAGRKPGSARVIASDGLIPQPIIGSRVHYR